MKTGILISLIIFVGTAWGLDVSPPQLSGIYCDPNPFSPNGDGRADSTVVHFSVSEPSYLDVWESNSGTPIITDVMFPAGANSFLWDGSGLSDGTWKLLMTARDTAGNQSDTLALKVIIDTNPPHIDTFSFEPNPFSPDSNGIQDYCKISFYANSTHPEEYDDYFIPNKIGRITIWNDSIETEWNFTADHTPTLPPFPVYFTLIPVSLSSGIDELDLHFLDWGSNEVDVALDRSPFYQRVGDLTNKMTTVSFWVDSIPQGESATVDLYAFTGNATVEIYDSLGSLVSQTNFWDVFRGDGGYFTLWGPGPIPDGLYNVKILLEDESYNTDIVSGEVIANSVPTSISNVFAEPPIISPANEDNNFDITQLHYTLSEGAYVSVKISRSETNFNPSFIVKTLLDSVIMAGGPHAVSYNGTDDYGAFLSVDQESTFYVVFNAVDPLTGDEDLKVIPLLIDNKAPTPPQLIPLETPTSDPTDTLKGSSEPGTLVKIYNNGSMIGEVTADSVTGDFQFSMNYYEGENSIYAVALDPVLNQSPPSDTINVVYDANPPTIASSFPEDGKWLGQDTVYSVWVTLEDASSGINLNASYASLRWEGETYQTSLSRVSPDTLLLTLTTPIEPGAGLDGHYSISVYMADVAGNSGTDTVHFGYDSEGPLASILPPDSALIDSFLKVEVTLSDDLSGPDYENTEINVTGPNGPVTGEKELGADSVLRFIITPPLRRDGSQDGRYFIEVIAKDIAGAQKDYNQTLVYDTKAPLVVSSSPESGEVVTTLIDKIWAIVTDSVVPGREPSGIDPWASQITLFDPDGNAVPGEKVFSFDTLGLNLTNSLSQTGTYTVSLYLKDNAGNDDSLSYNFFFDTESPSLLYTFPQNNSAVRDTLREFLAVFSDPGGTGMDHNNTTIKLLNPYGQERAGSLTWQGSDSLRLRLTVPLNPNGGEDGGYKALVWGQDKAGHPLVPTNPDTVSFIFDNHRPHLLDIWPDSGATNVYIPDSVGVDASDKVSGVSKVAGIDFDASTVTLINPDGDGVPGHKEYFDRGDGTGLIFWMIAPDAVLPDGEYRMDVHIVDKAGNSSDFVSTFETIVRAPTVISTSPDSGAIINSLEEAKAVVLDRTGSGIDTLASTIKVLDPDGSPISGSVRYEGADTLMTFIFTPAPPPSVNGIYTIYVRPFARNGQSGEEKRVPFTLDGTPPQLIASFPEPNDTLWETPEKLWLFFLEEDTGLDTQSVHFSLLGPTGQQLSGEKSISGDTIFFKPLEEWTEEGIYTVKFSVKDLAGNTTTDSLKFNFLDAFAWRTEPGEGDTVKSPLDKVEMVLERRRGSKVSSWYLYLVKSNGDTVPGTASQINESTYVYILNESLKADGSDVGPYSILFGATDDVSDTLSGEASFVYWVDTLPPAPPLVTNPPPKRTMEDTISISGKAEPSSKVIIWVNENITDSTEAQFDSSFAFTGVKISEGENVITLRAKDLFNNLSDSTSLVVIKGAPPFAVTADKPLTENNNNFYISLPKCGRVTLKVYNLRGDFVWKTTVSLDPGIKRPVSWPNLKNNDGYVVNNGPYLVVVKVKYSDGGTETKKGLFAVLR